MPIPSSNLASNSPSEHSFLSMLLQECVSDHILYLHRTEVASLCAKIVVQNATDCLHIRDQFSLFLSLFHCLDHIWRSSSVSLRSIQVSCRTTFNWLRKANWKLGMKAHMGWNIFFSRNREIGRNMLIHQRGIR